MFKFIGMFIKKRSIHECSSIGMFRKKRSIHECSSLNEETIHENTVLASYSILRYTKIIFPTNFLFIICKIYIGLKLKIVHFNADHDFFLHRN